MPQQNYLESAKEFGGTSYKDSAQEFGGIPIGQASSDLIQSPSEAQAKYLPGNINIGKTIAANLPSPQTVTETVAGAAAGAESPLLTAPTMALVEKLFDPQLKQKSNQENLSDIAKSTLYNEIFGRVLSGVGKVGSEIISPGSTFSPEMQSLLKYRPTASQLTGSNILNLIENFSQKAKESSLRESSDIASEEAKTQVSKILGRTLNLDEGEPLAQGIQQDAINTYNNYKNISNLRGTAIQSIANRNVQQVPVYKLGNTNLPITSQGGIPPLQQVGTYPVKGAIIPTNTIAEAQAILNDINKSHLRPDPNDPVTKKLQDLVNTVIQIDPTTGERYYKPTWDFGSAWETKKIAGDLGYEGVKLGNETIHDVRFQRIAKAINEDIENSIQNSGLWNNNDIQAALWNFREARQLAENRYALFKKEASGLDVQDLIQRKVNARVVQSPVDALNTIIDDPNKLENFLKTERNPIDTLTGTQYVFDNKRKDMASYQLMRMVNNSFGQDASDASRRVLDADKFFAQWNSPDPKIQASLKQLFNQQNRSDIEQFFKNVSKLDQKGQLGPSRYWMLRLGATGLTLGAGLMSGVPTNLAGGSAIIGGTIGLNMLGKLLTNPSTARLMVSLASGGPTNMPIRVAGRLIANTLKNAPMTLIHDDNTQTEGKINSEGKFVIPLGEK